MAKLKTIVYLLLAGVFPLLSGMAQTISVWTGSGDGRDWFDDNNWNNGTPGVNDSAVINAGADVVLSAPTAELASFEMNDGTLTFTNWTACLKADNVMINGGTVTLPPAYTNNVMSNRVWFVCENFTLESGAVIDAEGKGYGTGLNQQNTGSGPGRGSGSSSAGGGAGHGGYGGGAVGYGMTYGSAVFPELPGSGGGWGNQPGGPGGGAVRIDAQETVTINGTIVADGVKAPWTNGGGGSGGSVWITCRVIAGSGLVSANGGMAGTGGGNGNGGGGRIAIHYDSAAQALAGVPDIPFSVMPGMRATGVLASVGTLWFTDTLFLEGNESPSFNGSIIVPGFNDWQLGQLTISNKWIRLSGEDGFTLNITNDIVVTGAEGRLEIGGESYSANSQLLGTRNYRYISFSDTTNLLALNCGGDCRVNDGGKLAVYAGITGDDENPCSALVRVNGDLGVAANSMIIASSHPTNSGSVFWQVGTLTVEESALFSADVQGFSGSNDTLNRRGFGPGGGDTKCGGSYGGKGGDYNGGAAEPYGSTNMPALPGSGGGWGSMYGRAGAAGGGLIWLEAVGMISIHGTVSANGGNVSSWFYDPGGGSGGGIYLMGKEYTIGATAVIQADGGLADQARTEGASGGGGRVAVWSGYPYAEHTPPHRITITETPPLWFAGTVSASGGVGTGRDGEDGTIRFIHVLSPTGVFFSSF